MAKKPKPYVPFNSQNFEPRPIWARLGIKVQPPPPPRSPKQSPLQPQQFGEQI